MAPEIIRKSRFSLHVYSERGSRHHLPHCHIRRHEGGAETVVSLTLPKVLIGPEPTANEWKALVDGQQQLKDEWERINKPDE